MLLNWLHDLPQFVGALFVCAVFVVPALIGSYLLQPSVARIFAGEKDTNTVLGFLLNAFALYFGVLLALLSIAVFENYNKAEDAVDREAAGLIKLYRDINAYPAPAREEATAILHRYVDYVINDGWIQQAKGEVALGEVAIMNELHRRLAQFQPGNANENIQHAQTLRALDEFVEARRLRISAGGSAIPHIMWAVVLVGAVINIVVIWMFDLRRSTHAIIGGTLSLFIGLVIYMVAVLDAPFRGAHGIRPDPIAEVHRQSGMQQ